MGHVIQQNIPQNLFFAGAATHLGLGDSTTGDGLGLDTSLCEGEGLDTSLGEGEGLGTSLGEGEGLGTSLGEGEGDGVGLPVAWQHNASLTL